MSGKSSSVYMVLTVSAMICLAAAGCRNGSYMSTKQEVKDGNAVLEEIEIKQDIPRISTDYLFALTVKGPEKGHYLLVDCRSAEQVRQGTIPTAASLSSLQDDGDVDFPEDRSTDIIFFCDKEDCKTDDKAATLAVRDGYDEVRILEGGVSAWQEAGYSLTVPSANSRAL